MRRLAIDQSSSIVGWCVMDDDILVAYNLIFLKDIESKMSFLFHETNRLITEYQPDFVCWENLKTSQNPDIIRKLGEVTGILRCVCEEVDMPYGEAVPISVKAAICKNKGTGKKGRKTKIDLAKVICDKYDLEFPINKSGKNKGLPITSETHEFFNISDSIGLALYFYKKDG